MKIVLILFVGALAMFGQTYEIDPSHSAATFTVKHMMVTNVSGRFSNVQGKVAYDEKNFSQSSIEATIDVATTNTNEPKRDGHLKSAEFFDVANHPKMMFQSTKVYKADGVTKVDGNLTLQQSCEGRWPRQRSAAGNSA